MALPQKSPHDCRTPSRFSTPEFKSLIVTNGFSIIQAYKVVPMIMSYLGKGQTSADETDSSNGKSKRQIKMEKRANKGGQVKYATR